MLFVLVLALLALQMPIDICSYSTEQRGQLFNTNYRLFFKDADGKLISPWHDIPLVAAYNMVVEIPRGDNAKMEMSTKELMSPIKQDVKKGRVRFVDNLHTFREDNLRGYPWNYGALPQTWEDPGHEDHNTGAKGDNDPIDVIEIGSRVHPRGAVVPVKILGVLALLDEGETDWKVVAIDITDEKASQLNTIDDVRNKMPGLLEKTREWFRDYKYWSTDNHVQNEFAFDGKFKDRTFAEQIIQRTHGLWKVLIKELNPPLNTQCHVEEAVNRANDQEWADYLADQPEPEEPLTLPEDVRARLGKWQKPVPNPKVQPAEAAHHGTGESRIPLHLLNLK